jgi:hypothetical protein
MTTKHPVVCSTLTATAIEASVVSLEDTVMEMEGTTSTASPYFRYYCLELISL